MNRRFYVFASRACVRTYTPDTSICIPAPLPLTELTSYPTDWSMPTCWGGSFLLCRSKVDTRGSPIQSQAHTTLHPHWWYQYTRMHDGRCRTVRLGYIGEPGATEDSVSDSATLRAFLQIASLYSVLSQCLLPRLHPWQSC